MTIVESCFSSIYITVIKLALPALFVIITNCWSEILSKVSNRSDTSFHVLSNSPQLFILYW